MSSPGGRSEPRPQTRFWVLATLGYTLAALVATYPLLWNLSTDLAGATWDGPMFLWNFWYGPYAAFEQGSNPLETELLYHPGGISLVLNTHCLLPSLLAMPLQKIFGLVCAYNLVILGTFVASGLGTCLLARAAFGWRWAAFAAGLIFEVGHLRVSTLLFFNLIQTQFLVLFAWALWLALSRRSLRWAVSAGLLGAALCYTSYNLAVLAAMFALSTIVAFLLRPALGICANAGHDPAGAPGLGRKQILSRAAVVAATGLVLSAPILLMARAELQRHGNYVSTEQAESYKESVPLTRYLVRGPLWKPRDASYRHASYLGWGVMGLAALGIVARRKDRRMWFFVACAVAFLVLSLGPRFNWNGPVVEESAGGGSMPFAWLSGIPLVGEIREAHRFGLVGLMALSVVAGGGVACLLGRVRAWRGARAAGIVTLLLSAVLVFDSVEIPYPRRYRLPPPPAELAQIAEDPRDCCVLEFPSGRMGYSPFSYYETLHRKPVHESGQTARVPPDVHARSVASPAFVALAQAFFGKVSTPAELAQKKVAITNLVQRDRIGWVVIAWADHQCLIRGGEPASPRVLAELDRVVRTCFPVESVVYEPPGDVYEKWRSKKQFGRQRTTAIHRIYRLRLD